MHLSTFLLSGKLQKHAGIISVDLVLQNEDLYAFKLGTFFQVELRRLLRQHEEKEQKGTKEEPDRGAVPAYLLDRQQQTSGTVLSSMIKQKRKEKAVSN